ncbi:MAG: acetyl-CoA carboxylase carboxyltransferase subunit alpha [Polyangiales bacterium]
MANLPFEQPIAELTQRVRDLRALAEGDPKYAVELRRLEDKVARLARELFADLSPWQRVQLSRHPRRPLLDEYLERMVDDFVELHGDRTFGDDAAIVGGFARYPKGPSGRSVLVIGHQKGRGTKEAMRRNFGMPNPEGYRKARRLMELADRFRKPVITFVDTPGAYPGIGAEERGQSEAIGQCLLTMSRLRVPVVTCVIGEGGSGGALALAVANRVLALEHVWYSVISPEACASILWKDGSLGERAAEVLKPTAQMALDLGVVDMIVEEPPGGAHHDPDGAAKRLDSALREALASLEGLSEAELVEDRYRRFRRLGAIHA